MKFFGLAFLFLFSVDVFACPGVGNWSGKRNMGPGMMGRWMSDSNRNSSWMGCQMSMIRHHYYMQNGIPEKYAKMSNPLSGSQKVIESGKKLYELNCMACHGKNGSGNGVASKGLDPQPTNIARFSKMPMASDAYLFWTISEGGKEINTAMPSFKANLKDGKIWTIITYLRNM